MKSLAERFNEIEESRKHLTSGKISEIEKQHHKGKLTARERIERLLDPGSFEEIDLWSGAYKTGFDIDEVEIPGDAVVVGRGKVNDRTVYLWAQDYTVMNGTMARIHIAKIVRAMEKALVERVPIVGMYDSQGPRIQDMVVAHGECSYSTMLRFTTISSGVIPQISLIMGPCVGGAALSAAISDFVFMVRDTSYMHVASPPQGMSNEEYGGPRMHSQVSGNCDVLAESDEECLQDARLLLGFLPLNNAQLPPMMDTHDDPNRIDEQLMEMVPADTAKWFDMRKVVKQIVDDGCYFEIKRDYAPCLSVGFASFGGQVVGILANNSMYKAGCMDAKSSDKHARFTRFCDAFNIPLIYLADCPGFLPSVDEEKAGILRHGCMVIHAVAEATVPKILIVVRKLYAGAQLAMPTNIQKVDRILAWASADRGGMGAPELTSVIYKGRLDRAKSSEEREKIWREGIERMEGTLERFRLISNEDFIDPRQTRRVIIRTLRQLGNKKMERPARKHENMNL